MNVSMLSIKRYGLNVTALMLLILAANGSAADGRSDSPAYTPAADVTGKCRILYSDPLRNLVLDWRKEFLERHPKAEVQVVGFEEQGDIFLGGISVENADLWITEGFWEGEGLAEFKRRHGFDPMGIPVGLDIYAVIVNAQNPIRSVSVEQLRSIYSDSDDESLTWSRVGLRNEWSDRRINPHMKSAPSLLAGFFRRLILNKEAYSRSVQMHGTMSEIVAAVERDEAAVGCVRLGFVTPRVRVVSLEQGPQRGAVQPSAQTAQSGVYPLSKTIYATPRLVTAGEPRLIEREFIGFLLSREGQGLLSGIGYTQPGSAFVRENPAYKAMVGDAQN